VACCPGGTASNVVCYLARANVALSVSMTMCSTFAAIALTPLLTKWLVGELVEVDLLKLFKDTLVVVVPVVIGIWLKHLAPRAVKKIEPAAPLVSVIVIVLIVAAIIEVRAADIKEHWRTLLLAVCLLHGFAFAMGYGFARLFGYAKLIRRTVSIEVGMQNSGLATHLAKNNPGFGAVAATPCALSAVMHCIFGSFLAALWRRDAEKMDNEDVDATLSATTDGK
jgi:BASS family bile acid:Na+ symporter